MKFGGPSTSPFVAEGVSTAAATMEIDKPAPNVDEHLLENWEELHECDIPLVDHTKEVETCVEFPEDSIVSSELIPRHHKHSSPATHLQEQKMEQIPAASNSQVLPHIVQVYPPSKMHNPQIIQISHQTSQTNVTYQTLMSENVHNSNLQNQIQTSQNQIIMSCPPTQLHSVQSLQSQVLQSSDLGQSLQIASHVIVPQIPVFKQHMLINGLPQEYFEQYQTYQREPCVITKLETSSLQTHDDVNKECQTANQTEIDNKSPNMPMQTQLVPHKMKKTRSKIANPSKWESNVRKLKHQRGEAYISRRGKYVPEKRVRNTKDCLKSCKFKCNERISDADRQLIFKVFYSLNTNEKRHFLLNTTERNHVKRIKYMRENIEDGKRKYHFKYFFLVRAVRYTVCKNFYLGTLSISQRPVYSVHMTKSEINTPKPDGRGVSENSRHETSNESKDMIRKHIMSFKTVDSNNIKHYSNRKRYLDSNLNVKIMYSMYVKHCENNGIVPLKLYMYRKIFKSEFNLDFKKTEKTCCKCKEPLKK